jgi:biotin carboxyl carrier protein
MKITIEIDGTVHEVEVEEKESFYQVIIDGVSHRAHIQEKKEGLPEKTQSPRPVLPIQSPPSSPQPVSQPLSGTITAPMPGTILKIRVNSGASVKMGDILLTLEAMKMENEITSPMTGVVKEILVSEGQTVNAGDVLAHME